MADRTWQVVLAIDPDNVGDGGVEYFPLLITEGSLITNAADMIDADGDHPCQANAGDVLSYDDDTFTARLPLEIVSTSLDNTPASSTLEWWTQTPFASSVVATYIGLRWRGNGSETQPAADAAFGSQAVWEENTVQKFAGVWHLKDGADTSHVNDSTSNGHTGTKGAAGNPAEVNAQIGQGQSIDGTCVLSVDDSSDFTLQTGDSYTISAWGKQVSTSGIQNIYRHDSGGEDRPLVCLRTSSNKAQFFLCSTIATIPVVIGTTDVGTGWRYLCGVRDVVADKLYVYLDGLEDSGGGVEDTSAATIDPSPNLYLGSLVGMNEFWSGIIDEVRVSRFARSAAWVLTDYNCQNDPAAFCVAGTPEAVGGTNYEESLTLSTTGGFSVTPTVSFQDSLALAAQATLAPEPQTAFADAIAFAAQADFAPGSQTALQTALSLAAQADLQTAARADFVEALTLPATQGLTLASSGQSNAAALLLLLSN